MPASRADVIEHLRERHSWDDRDQDGRVRSSLITVDGFFIVTTEELLGIHRELALLEQTQRSD